MLSNMSNTSSHARRVSFVDMENAENEAPLQNRRSSQISGNKRGPAAMASREKTRAAEKKRRRKKEAEREMKRKQRAKQALKKQKARIQQVVAAQILQMQAKQDSLQRKVTECARLQNYEKAKVISEQIRELKLRTTSMQDALRANPMSLAYLLETPKDANTGIDATPQKNDSTTKQQTSHQMRSNVLPQASPSIPHFVSTPVQPDFSSVSTTTETNSQLCASFHHDHPQLQAPFSPAPAVQRLQQPSSNQPPSRRKSHHIDSNPVSMRRSSFGGIANTHETGTEGISDHYSERPDVGSMKMSQGFHESQCTHGAQPPMAVPVVGYATPAGTIHAQHHTSADNNSCTDANQHLTASEQAVLEAAAQIQLRRARVDHVKRAATVDQKCQCVVM